MMPLRQTAEREDKNVCRITQNYPTGNSGSSRAVTEVRHTRAPTQVTEDSSSLK